MKLIALLLLVLVQRGTGISTDPLVYWSMDKYEGKTLQPDFGDEDTFTCDLPSTNDEYFQHGILNTALFVKKKIKLIERIWKTDCIRNPSKCPDGLTIAFWLNVNKFTRKIRQVIMRSSGVDKDLPGIYVGGDEDDQDSLLFMVRTAAGKQYQATVPRNYVVNKWTHIAMIWSNDDGIKVFVNGSLLSDNQYTSSPKVSDVSSSYPMRVDFILGDIFGPAFLLDDFWIFYKNLTEIETRSLYEMYVPATTPKAATTEQTPTPRSSTYKTTSANNGIVPVTNTTQLEPSTKDTDGFEVTTKKMVTEEMEVFITKPNTLFITDITNMNQTNITTPTIPPTKPKIITTTIKAPVTSSDWQFYNQTTFHIIIGCITLVFILCGIYLVLSNCCGSSPSKTVNKPIYEEQQLTPLV